MVFQLDEYKKKLFNEAERLVKDEFPRKVLEFDEMLRVGKSWKLKEISSWKYNDFSSLS